ncbi:MAG: YihA family ribosome biogenesis GTP-binding protein [Tissierellia bacterium]|nr:YihA family ribosome biogenesis GTP-binding protein [Tissierellia bacterium]
MKILKAEIEAVAVEKKQYPEGDLPEIAFAGRSNVGKSSFINAMVNRKNLARTSGTPGKTRTINFYNINDSLRFVDLPGYGYARASKSEQDKWAKTINEYLGTRENLVEVFQVVDIRHEPTNDDMQMYEWIKAAGFTGIVIATKLDKITRNARAKNISIIRKKLEIEDKTLILPFSSETKEEVEGVWAEIEKLL